MPRCEASRRPLSVSGVTEILFYHLQRQPLEKVLPTLVERSLARGLARGDPGVERGAAAGPRRRALDLYRRQLPAPRHRPRAGRGEPAGGADACARRNPNARRDPLPGRGRAAARRRRGLRRASASCSTAPTRTRCCAPASSGGRPRRPATPSPIGSRTTTAAGRRRRDRSARADVIADRMPRRRGHGTSLAC